MPAACVPARTSPGCYWISMRPGISRSLPSPKDPALIRGNSRPPSHLPAPARQHTTNILPKRHLYFRVNESAGTWIGSHSRAYRTHLDGWKSDLSENSEREPQPWNARCIIGLWDSANSGLEGVTDPTRYYRWKVISTHIERRLRMPC